MFRYGAIGLNECYSAALELDIKLICEDGSTGHEDNVAGMALAILVAGLRLPNSQRNDE